MSEGKVIPQLVCRCPLDLECVGIKTKHGTLRLSVLVRDFFEVLDGESRPHDLEDKGILEGRAKEISDHYRALGDGGYFEGADPDHFLKLVPQPIDPNSFQ